MNSFLDLAKKRYSSRKYRDKPVEKEKIELVLEAARIAPSAVNYQPWQFLIVQSEEKKNLIWKCYHRDWFKLAPLTIIICADHHQSWKRQSDNKDHADIDAAIAIDHMTLMAAELELATCWICNFDVEKVRKYFSLPQNLEPIALLPLGYPADKCNPERHREKRKSLNDISKII